MEEDVGGIAGTRWLEMRRLAEKFSSDWKGAKYEKGNTQLFYRDLLEIFGKNVRECGVFEKCVKMLQKKDKKKYGFIDFLWPGVMIAEQKSRGRSLDGAELQAINYLLNANDLEIPKHVMACDFANFRITNLETNDTVKFPLSKLKDNLQHMMFMVDKDLGMGEQHEITKMVAQDLSDFYNMIHESSGLDIQQSQQYMIRLAFCMFAEDTGIFPPGSFRKYLWGSDASRVGSQLTALFRILDTSHERRQNTEWTDELRQFTYINGELFRDEIPPVVLTTKMRAKLDQACRHNWADVSPDIFGSLFQAIMPSEEQRGEGAHYTEEGDILKVIRPLFLDALRGEFEKIKGKPRGARMRLLASFQDRLASLKFLDPACGSGNFLTVAYRQLRLLEKEVVLARVDDGQTFISTDDMIKVSPSQFYGIELSPFSAKIARVAMWMTDHLMNNDFSENWSEALVRIPLEDRHAPHIREDNALRIDWNDVLPSEECDFILGNPPFGGSKTANNKKRTDLIDYLDSIDVKSKALDYVAGWFLKAANYASDMAGIAFVATNSITQGEQVKTLWTPIFEAGFEIKFAYTSFQWKPSGAGGPKAGKKREKRIAGDKKAAVIVVIVGLAKSPGNRTLYVSDPLGRSAFVEDGCRYISPYLFSTGAVPVLVEPRATPLCPHLPRMVMGCQTVDWGQYVFKTEDEKDDFIKKEPGAADLVVPFINGDDCLHGRCRYLLNLHDVPPGRISKMKHVMRRVKRVGELRKKAGNYGVPPQQFTKPVIPAAEFLVVPQTSSSARKYIPFSFQSPPVVPNDTTRVILEPVKGYTGLMMSKLHMIWMEYIGGRMKNDYRYSPRVVYNTFPVPRKVKEAVNGGALDGHVDEIRTAIDGHAGSDLSSLYGIMMPRDLKIAHRRLDRRVYGLYGLDNTELDSARLDRLLKLYKSLLPPG